MGRGGGIRWQSHTRGVSKVSSRQAPGSQSMRRALDRLYAFALWLAAGCLLGIAVLVALQIAGRLLDGTLVLFGLSRAGLIVPSLDEIAGYLLAAASFLALAGTLKAGAHIRTTM